MPSVAKLSFALIGFSSAAVAARMFVFLQGLCRVACFTKPRVMGFLPHHIYYGIGIVFLAVVPLVFAESPAIRWDASLFLGAGVGLFADELGSLLRIVSYWSLTSMMIPLMIAIEFGSTIMLMIVRHHDTREFGLMKRGDAATTASLVLFMFGFLYFEKSLGMIVQFIGLSSWVSSLVLMLAFGRRHFVRVDLLPEISVSDHR